MLVQFARFCGLFALLALCCATQPHTLSQQPLPQQPALTVEAAPDADGPDIKGVEVLARGPVHEAFATPTSEAKATAFVGKKPPLPVEEMPPDEKPEGDAVWIGGYFAWDDDRQDFLWVSGCWRLKPQGKEWVPGYWREQADQWQWVPGFWTNAATEAAPAEDVTYYPEPPAPPQVAPPGEPPGPEMIHVPGHWYWVGNRYVWRAGYWTRAREGWVYVPSHYRWTPFGHVFVAGYWDYSVAHRGVLYAPVVVDTVVVGPRFVYTPYYAVSDAVVLDAFFIHTGRCHYYFGDYYGPRYSRLGFETCVVYSRRCYDPIIVYRRYEYRHEPRWFDVQVNLVFARDSGRAPVPPRTLVQQRTVINNTTINNTTINNVNVNNVSKTAVLAPTTKVLAAKGGKSVKMDTVARAQAKESAQTARQTVLEQRQKTEVATPGGGANLAKPKTAAFKVPSVQPTGKTSGGAGQPITGGGLKNPATGNPANIGKGNTNPVGKGVSDPLGKQPTGGKPLVAKPIDTKPPSGTKPVDTKPSGKNPGDIGIKPKFDPKPPSKGPGDATKPKVDRPPTGPAPGSRPKTTAIPTSDNRKKDKK